MAPYRVARAFPSAQPVGELHSHRRGALVKAISVSICENRTCKKQGSQQIMKLLEDIEQEGHGLSVRRCGCLGQCGNGPNMHLSPPGVVVRGISTPAAAFRMLREHCNIEVAEESQLFVQLRLRGNNLAAQGHLAEALEAYREALQHAPSALAYKIHSNMSLLALTSGDVASAVSAAATALEQAPRDFTTAKIRMIEACLAAQESDAATEYLRLAVRDDASFQKTVIFRELDKKVQAAATG